MIMAGSAGCPLGRLVAKALVAKALAAMLILLPAVIAASAAADDKAPSISVEFNDMDLRAAIRLLANELGQEVVMDESVSGRLTLNIDSVEPLRALEGILLSRDLDMRFQGGFLHVAPAAVFVARDGEAQRLQEATAALSTAYLQINYADVEVILALVTGEADAAGSLLSDRGSASMDARTNTLIMRDTEARLDDVRALLRQLDVPVRQVLIETRIVSASTEIGRQLGTRWGAFSGNPQQTDCGREQRAGTGAAPGNGLTVLADHRQSSTVAASVLRRRLLLELELSALENSGQAELIARPRVTTQDNVPASIRSGVRIPYQAQAGGTAGGSITEFVDAVLSLDVTPLITPDGRIIMQLGIRQDSVASGSGDVPAINTNTVTTQVLVDNGDTLVLGGIFRDEQTREEVRTPILGDVPGLGWLFRRTQQAARRTELLIFITPQIVSP
tara:strand:- start:244 stop:1581 length:1338 start_codon:yes stop_codon:yes gene_type:complete